MRKTGPKEHECSKIVKDQHEIIREQLYRQAFIFARINSKTIDVIPLKEKPMHIPRVPPTDPTIPGTSNTNRSLYSIIFSGWAKL